MRFSLQCFFINLAPFQQKPDFAKYDQRLTITGCNHVSGRYENCKMHKHKYEHMNEETTWEGGYRGIRGPNAKAYGTGKIYQAAGYVTKFQLLTAPGDSI